jgi:hypothetical protein
MRGRDNDCTTAHAPANALRNGSSPAIDNSASVFRFGLENGSRTRHLLFLLFFLFFTTPLMALGRLAYF